MTPIALIRTGNISHVPVAITGQRPVGDWPDQGCLPTTILRVMFASGTMTSSWTIELALSNMQDIDFVIWRMTLEAVEHIARMIIAD
jgi:hypothetical protein